MKNYIVQPDGVIQECGDLAAWALWFEASSDLPFRKGGRRVAETVAGDVRVSTVFLGLEHLHGMLFETMVFGGDHDEHQQRSRTLDGALSDHVRVVEMCLTTPQGD